METEAESPPIHLPWPLRALNAVGPAARALGLLEPAASPEPYLRWARKKTGLDDFGPFDVEAALTRLLETIHTDVDLHLFGRTAFDQLVRRNLVQLLMMTRAFEEDPALDDVEVDEPLIVVCSPRTGSTLLHNLLALHERARSPRMWELHRPCPPPRPETIDVDPRIQQSDREFGAYYRLIPEMKAIHFFAPTAVEECTHLFNGVFMCRTSFSTMAGLSSYMTWAMEQDFAPVYRHYRRSLKVLKRHYPDHFLALKSPAHLLTMDALAEVFPNARVVHIHRDPATAAGSFCSLVEAVQISMRDDVDPLAIGEMWQQIWTPALLDSIRIRDEGKLNILDVNFQDLVRDPQATVTRVYRHFGYPEDPALSGRIDRYLEEHPKGEFGEHSYSLARYGLDREALHEIYAPYIERFDIPLENPKGG